MAARKDKSMDAHEDQDALQALSDQYPSVNTSKFRKK